MKCLTNPDTPFDIGVVGAPFDTAVSYRPGGLLFFILFWRVGSVDWGFVEGRMLGVLCSGLLEGKLLYLLLFRYCFP